MTTSELDVVELLTRRRDGACFATELRASARPAPADAVECALQAAARAGLVAVIDHASPDEHLHGDLRVVTSLRDRDEQAALDAAERTWDEWVREAVRNHRCT